MSKTETIDSFKALQAEALEIFKRKNADYGDSFAEDGVLGVMVRIKDKLSRFITLARKEGEGACKDESIRDTLIDLSNYALMAVITHEAGESWQGEKRTIKSRRSCCHER